MKYFITLFISGICLMGFSKPFPKFSYKSTDGITIDNSYLAGKKSIIVLYHLGCPAAMSLINDLNQYYTEIDTSKIQIIGILENTNQQIIDFYADSSNMWSDLRTYFKIEQTPFPLIGECETENLRIEGDNILVDSQCSIISKKIKTKECPTIIYTDEKGNITKVYKGYFIGGEYENRISNVTRYIDK